MEVSEFFKKLAPYAPVQPPSALAAKAGLEEEQLVKLDANENPFGSPLFVKEALEKGFPLFHIYPASVGVHPDQVVCGAGSDDILEIIIRAFHLSAVITASPTFSMYAFLARLNVPNVPLVDVPRNAASFALDVNGLVAAIRAHANEKEKIPLVFLASPNNPTGTYLTHGEAKELLKERCILVIDEAYIEFSEQEGFQSSVSLLKDHPNLIVTRTLSKWAGLAGLRVGFSFSSRDIARLFMSAKQPYNMDWPAVSATRAVYANKEKLLRDVSVMVEQRKLLEKYLGAEEFRKVLRVCEGSKANFLMLEILPGSPMTADKLTAALLSVGIVIRYFGGSNKALSNFIRISSGLPSDTLRVISALASLLLHNAVVPPVRPSSQTKKLFWNAIPSDLRCVLFDMDGVMANVSQSYRSSILATCIHFGKNVTPEQIQQEKSLPDSNNDWKVSHRIIGRADVSLQQVTDVFEEHYGKLKSLEWAMIHPSLIVAIASKYAVGIITGRPRRDAEEFLERFGIRSVFRSDAIFCMEDGPAKPSSVGIEKVLKTLQISPNQAIYLGDTPDDQTAAAKAGVCPIGIGEMRGLSEAGAKFVCKSTFVPELFDLISLEPRKPEPTGRKAELARNTKETQVKCAVNLDGKGIANVNTGLGFLDHMICALSKHSHIDIDLVCNGDLHVDDHHTTEDCGIVLGETMKTALGSRSGILRYGSAYAPLDEALARAVIDISSRPSAFVSLNLVRHQIGTVSAEMLTHFLCSFATSCGITLHVDVLKGDNDHHKSESAFKAVALALKTAVSVDAKMIGVVPSTKGVL